MTHTEGMTPREQVDRLQRIGRAVLERMHALRLSDELDETFYEALRESMVLAGATDGEIDAVAQLYITHVVEATEPDSEERLSQFALITDHLACTRVRICLNQADTVLTVEFPNRPHVH